jgi:hypothetical protein
MKNDTPESATLGRDAGALKRTKGIDAKQSNGRLGADAERIVEVLASAGIRSRTVNCDVVGVEDPDVDPSAVDDLLPYGWEVVSDDRPATIAREGRA